MSKHKNNRFEDIDGKAAFVIPMTLLRHPTMAMLSPFGHKLLFDLGKQYTGFNNGYLCASWSLMKDQGWHSSFTLHKATLECEHYNLIVRTLQGGIHKATLHGFTWRRIDEKPGWLLDVAPTERPSNAWKDVCEVFVYAPRAHGHSRHPSRIKQPYEKRVVQFTS